MEAKRRVEVLPYSSDWTIAFCKEAAVLQHIFGEQIIAVHHIGSTAIPGMSAKPIIDIMIEVRNINKVDGFNEAMVDIGYVPKDENGIPGRRYFQKGGYNRTHHIHIYEEGHHEVTRHLRFIEYMKAHPIEAAQYAALKVTLAKQYPENIEGYIEGKDAFVKNIDRKAAQWANVSDRKV